MVMTDDSTRNIIWMGIGESENGDNTRNKML